MQHQRAYRYRLEPTADQEAGLYRFAGARRWMWNWGLQRKQDHYQQYKVGLSFRALCEELPRLKADPTTAWLKEIDSQLLQQALRDLEQSFKAFFARRARYPRFKSRKRGAFSFRIPQRVTVADGRVYVPKIGDIKLRYHRPIVGETKSATFTRDAAGHWYVSLIVAFDLSDEPAPLPPIEHTVGVDVGLKDFAVLSDGTRIAPPKFYRTAERKLKRAQRALSRKVTGSRNRAKARQQVARLHTHVANQRRDWLHKQSAAIIRHYDAVCIEDLNVRGLAKSKLAKSIHDAGWSFFRSLLAYKTCWNRKHLAVIDRFYPSSRRCGQCGAINADLQLADRGWRCTCGAVHDRDLNAATNIQHEGYRLLAAGHADRRNACGQPPRPPMAAGLDEPGSLPL
ncbi:MAG TPA: transposase [Herpetosiphonaceae bacterium]